MIQQTETESPYGLQIFDVLFMYPACFGFLEKLDTIYH